MDEDSALGAASADALPVAEPVVELDLLNNSLRQAIYQAGVAEPSNAQQDHHSTASSTSSSRSRSRTSSMVESTILWRAAFWTGFFKPPANQKQGGKLTLLTTFSSELKLWSTGMVDLAEAEEDEGYSSASEDGDEEDVVLFKGRGTYELLPGFQGLPNEAEKRERRAREIVQGARALFD